MALSSFTELKTDIANWLDRDDLTTQIPSFIKLAEARISRELKIRAMETRSTASTTAGVRMLRLPTGYLEMRNIQLNTTPITALEYLSPEMMDRLWGGSTTGRPKTYSLIGDEMLLGPTPDSVMTVEMAYYKKFDALSGSVADNWLLTNAPDIYLYASLLEAAPYIQDAENLQVWHRFYKEGIERLQLADDRDRYSGSVLRIMTTSGNP
jgi:hypothetical protein